MKIDILKVLQAISGSEAIWQPLLADLATTDIDSAIAAVQAAATPVEPQNFIAAVYAQLAHVERVRLGVAGFMVDLAWNIPAFQSAAEALIATSIANQLNEAAGSSPIASLLTAAAGALVNTALKPYGLSILALSPAPSVVESAEHS